MNLTPRLGLQYPNLDDERWDQPVVADLLALDASFLGSLAVVPTEVPSASMNFVVRGGAWVDATGLLHTVADSAVQTMFPSTTRYVYLNAAGALTVATAWPAPGAGKFVPLAIVVAGVGSLAIQDCRLPLGLVGS